jgi:heat shock protein HtpX
MIWEQIRSNQIRSTMLTVLMGVVLLALGFVIGELFFGSGTTGSGGIIGLVIALVVWGIMNLVALTQGDSILLAVSGARKIEKKDHPRLFDVVEEMKIASGLEKMPDVYIIDDPALNAFATGRDAQHASVAITSGLLQKLNRDELQGVIAHEIGHIRNRDVQLMMRLSILLGSIVMISWYATRFLFLTGGSSGGGRRRNSSGGGGGQIIILAIGIVLMILAPIFAQLIYFAVSRKREYLADASSALYTRYPEGLASALEKLSNSNTQVQKANKATAPMYIINPLEKRSLSAESLTSTHPPLAERIRILRAMSGASYASYDQAYKAAKGGTSVIPASALAAPVAALRAASPDTAPVENVTEKVERTRETSDMLWNMNNYKIIDCDCGTRLRISPTYTALTVRCPHCGRLHPTPR